MFDRLIYWLLRQVHYDPPAVDLLVDIEDADGTQSSLPVTDHTFQLRLIVIAAIVAAFIIGRIRS